jgi:deoxycytidine triphosphate deaminase
MATNGVNAAILPCTGLIGGQDLKGMVRLQRLGEPSDPTKIGVRIDDRYLRARSQESLDEVLTALQKDLDVKAANLSKFVSIRIHASDIAMRMEGEPGSGSSVSIESGLEDFWDVTEEFDLRIRPFETLLIHSLEWIDLPANVYAVLQARTTVGNRGLDITPTNVVVPGFKGPLGLQIRNVTGKQICVPKHYAFAELFFFTALGSYTGAGNSFAKDNVGVALVNSGSARPEKATRAVWKSVVFSLLIIGLGATTYACHKLQIGQPYLASAFGVATLLLLLTVAGKIVGFDVLAKASDVLRGVVQKPQDSSK